MTHEELEVQKGLGELNRAETKSFNEGKKILKIPWMCSYCDYGDTCRREAREEVGDKGRSDLVIIDKEKSKQNEKREKTNKKITISKPSKGKTGKNSRVKKTK